MIYFNLTEDEIVLLVSICQVGSTPHGDAGEACLTLFKGGKRAEDVKIEFGPAHVQELNQWFEAAFEHGLIKTKVAP